MSRHITISKLRKFFNEKELEKKKKIDGVGFTDPKHIMMVAPKNESTKELIENNFDVKESKEPQIAFKVRTKYPIEYLKNILDFIKSVDKIENYFWINMGKETPVCFETDNFKLYLAPSIPESPDYKLIEDKLKEIRCMKCDRSLGWMIREKEQKMLCDECVEAYQKNLIVTSGVLNKKEGQNE